MTRYRLCIFGSDGYVTEIYEPECGSDADALQAAERLVRGARAVDIWEGGRWIGWLDGKAPLFSPMAFRSCAPH